MTKMDLHTSSSHRTWTRDKTESKVLLLDRHPRTGLLSPWYAVDTRLREFPKHPGVMATKRESLDGGGHFIH